MNVLLYPSSMKNMKMQLLNKTIMMFIYPKV